MLPSDLTFFPLRGPGSQISCRAAWACQRLASGATGPLCLCARKVACKLLLLLASLAESTASSFLSFFFPRLGILNHAAESFSLSLSLLSSLFSGLPMLLLMLSDSHRAALCGRTRPGPDCMACAVCMYVSLTSRSPPKPLHKHTYTSMYTGNTPCTSTNQWVLLHSAVKVSKTASTEQNHSKFSYYGIFEPFEVLYPH